MNADSKLFFAVCVFFYYLFSMDINNITEKIIGAAFEVSNHLGCGFLEKVYENALMIELRHNNLKVESQKQIAVFYKKCNVGEYVADLFVDNKVIVELKSVKQITEIHEAQLMNYLKATGMKVGLLINFGSPKVQIKRMINNL